MADKSNRLKARLPRGFVDRRPDRVADADDRRRLARSTSATASRPLDTGAFEYADALGKFLPDADRPNEGVFALQDDDEQWMALRYDLTAPLARFAAQNWETLPKPFRRYAFGRCGATRSPAPAASASSSSATPTPWARPGPRPTPRSSPWPSRAWRPRACRPAAVVKINNRKLLNGLMGRGRRHRRGPEARRAARRRQARPPGPGRRAPAAGRGPQGRESAPSPRARA